jgi:hypothetical protein
MSSISGFRGNYKQGNIPSVNNLYRVTEAQHQNKKALLSLRCAIGNYPDYTTYPGFQSRSVASCPGTWKIKSLLITDINRIKAMKREKHIKLNL